MELKPTTKRPTGRWGGAVGAAAWFGSISGMTLLVIVTTVTDGVPASEVWAIPIIIFGYGSFFAFPVCALGLFLFGVPLTLALKRWAERRWMPLIAVVVGAIAGRLAYHLVDHAIFFGIDDLWRWRIADIGVLFGSPTGLIWLIFARRLLRNQRIADAPPEPLPS